MKSCKFIVIYSLFLIQGLFAGAKFDLSICAIFQDEAPYMREWIEFHRLVGVEHFWLYNNNSTDNYAEVLAPYIHEGVVELIEWPSDRNDWDSFCFSVQPRAYTDAVKRARGVSKWLAILDLDEFLFSPIQNNVAKLLNREFSSCAGVCVNWQLYGTSFIYSIPTNKTTIEMLTLKAETKYPRNLLYKSIVQPKYVTECLNPHYCNYVPKVWHVNTRHERVDPNNNHAIVVDKLRINHYWARDEMYSETIKIPRYEKFGNGSKESVWDEVSRLNKVTDGAILKFVPALRKRLGLLD